MKFWDLSSVSLLSKRRKLHWVGCLNRSFSTEANSVASLSCRLRGLSDQLSIFPLDRAAETGKTICAFSSEVLGSALFLHFTLAGVCLCVSFSALVKAYCIAPHLCRGSSEFSEIIVNIHNNLTCSLEVLLVDFYMSRQVLLQSTCKYGLVTFIVSWMLYSSMMLAMLRVGEWKEERLWMESFYGVEIYFVSGL